jgi:hypothetical protein
MSKFKIIISDKHIGTTLWQKSILESIGHEVIIKTLSHHFHYFDKNYISDNFFCDLVNKDNNEIDQYMREYYSDITHILCSFPPSYIEVLEKMPLNIKIILNIGHRIHIHLDPHKLEEFTEKIKYYYSNNRFLLSTMSEYDFHYVKYYTGLELQKLYVSCLNLPKNIQYNPNSNLILIGPSHNLNNLMIFDSIEKLNNLSLQYATKFNKIPYFFNFIKNIYINFNFEDLVNHPAVLIFPYSAFSISMVELYQLNIPFIVPDKNILAGKMNDVKLYPIYHNENNVINFDKKYLNNLYPSPNSIDINDEKKWIEYMFFNQVENSLIFNSEENLFNIIYNTDFNEVSKKMKIENELNFNNEKIKWKHFLEK